MNMEGNPMPAVAIAGCKSYEMAGVRAALCLLYTSPSPRD